MVSRSSQASILVAEKVRAELEARFSTGEPIGGIVPADRVQHRIGSQVVLDGFLDSNGEPRSDCDALVWVTVIRRYRTTVFPAEEYVSTNCGQPRAITVQVGIARCSAMMDEYGTPPPADRIAHEARRGLDDAGRLDAALCAAGRSLSDAGTINGFAIDASEPVGPEGGVVSWMQQASFWLA